MSKVYKRDAWGAVAVSCGAEIFLQTGLMGACINRRKNSSGSVGCDGLQDKKKKDFPCLPLSQPAPSLDGANLRHHRMGLTGLTCPLRSHSPHSRLPECSGPEMQPHRLESKPNPHPVSPNMSSEFKHSMWVLALMEWSSVFLTMLSLFFFLAGGPNTFNATLNKCNRS